MACGARKGLLIVASGLSLWTAVAGAGQAALLPSQRGTSGGLHSTIPTYLVLMVLDGARPDYLATTRLPHVTALRTTGTTFSQAIDGILESETPAGHTALATGSTPRRNGILGFDWAQNDNDYSLFSPERVASGAIEQIMAAAKVPTIAGLYKARYPGSRVVALSGHKYYAADPLGGPRADVIMYFQGDPHGRYVPVAIPGHTPPAPVLHAPGLVRPTTHLPPGQDDHLATLLALAAFRQLHQRITLINYPEFDWPLGHVFGGDDSPARVAILMRTFDQDLGLIEAAYRKAGVLDRTLFVITADHGMAPVSRFVPQRIVTNAVIAAHTAAPAISWSTGAYVWLKDARKAPSVARRILAAHDPGIQSVYSLSRRGRVASYTRAGGWDASAGVDAAERDLLGTLINGHEPNVVAFCRAGATFSSPSTHWRADHGGAAWQSQHIPLVLSGPGIKVGAVVTHPALLIDVAPTILADMGVSPTGMEGHVLADALIDRGGRFVPGRAAEIRSLGPLVGALLAQQQYEQTHRW